MTYSKVQKIVSGAALIGLFGLSSSAFAGTYTGQVTAMGVTHCTTSTTSAQRVIPWIKFAGFFWTLEPIDFYNWTSAGYYQSSVSTQISSMAEYSLATGNALTGGCLNGTAMSNCASVSGCGDGRTYWYLDVLTAGSP